MKKIVFLCAVLLTLCACSNNTKAQHSDVKSDTNYEYEQAYDAGFEAGYAAGIEEGSNNYYDYAEPDYESFEDFLSENEDAINEYLGG